VSLDAFWQGLEACGWQAELPPDELARIRAELARHPEPETAYEALASVVFDTETIYGSGLEGDDLDSYAKILRLFAAGSQGVFTPQHLLDEWDEESGTARVGFDYRGQHYEVTVELQSDWFQAEVYDLVNKALEEQGVPQRFEGLPVVDQVLHAAFVRPETFQRAKASGLIPDMAKLIEAETGMAADELQELLGAAGELPDGLDL
jgi:hypothetical protein